tara:strand:- start:30 stop:383 length:354 start_codon:yes stop_codon:yes gene_type:complete
MYRFPLETKIPMDIWREIKTYIVHNIRTQSKHLKNYPEIINFNNVINDIPRKCTMLSGPKIVYQSVTKPFRCVKMVYSRISPSLVIKNLPSNNENYSLIIEYTPFFTNINYIDVYDN